MQTMLETLLDGMEECKPKRAAKNTQAKNRVIAHSVSKEGLQRLGIGLKVVDPATVSAMYDIYSDAKKLAIKFHESGKRKAALKPHGLLISLPMGINIPQGIKDATFFDGILFITK